MTRKTMSSEGHIPSPRLRRINPIEWAEQQSGTKGETTRMAWAAMRDLLASRPSASRMELIAATEDICTPKWAAAVFSAARRTTPPRIVWLGAGSNYRLASEDSTAEGEFYRAEQAAVADALAFVRGRISALMQSGHSAQDINMAVHWRLDYDNCIDAEINAAKTERLAGYPGEWPYGRPTPLGGQP